MIHDGEGSMYQDDQQRFYQVVRRMLSPDVKGRLRANRTLGNSDDEHCGSDLLARVYDEIDSTGAHAKTAVTTEARAAT